MASARSTWIAKALIGAGLALAASEANTLAGCAGPGAVESLTDLPPVTRADLVDVSAPRELRGLWVATVANLDWPRRQGGDATAQQQELRDMVAQADDLGFNALVFQVRPEGDALYASELEPWSRFLTGVQGRDPGFDPLKTLVEAAHARGIEVHAWFNPYRASSARSSPTASTHVSKWAAGHTRPWGSLLWLDPGSQPVREHCVSVVADVIERYDVDGVHLDDYFYPYPQGKASFPDDATYAVYVKSGGNLSKEAWRQDNVNTLVSGLSTLVNDRRPDVRFGISPFGIYRPGQPEGIRGLDQVATLNADPLHWLAQDWVDYLAPQLYWPTTREQQRYDRLLDWWNEASTSDKPLIVGLDVSKIGKDPAWPITELRTQIRLARAADRTSGQIWFRATHVLSNQSGLADLAGELYAAPAIPPLLMRKGGVGIAPPSLIDDADGVALVHDDKSIRSYLLYERVDRDWVARERRGPGEAHWQSRPGEWAASAISRTGAESQAILLP